MKRIKQEDIVRQIQLINDDYAGRTEHTRHTCRGILIRDGRILLGHEVIEDKYIIPGGGMEKNETYEQCCEREMLEETGLVVRAADCFLEIEELFMNCRQVSRYFICEFIEDTGSLNLTEREQQIGCELVWMKLDEAAEEFGAYEKYHESNIPDYGLYRREYTALKVLCSLIETKNTRMV